MWRQRLSSNNKSERERQSLKSERERQIAYDITYMWNLKYGTNEATYKTNRLTDIHNNLWLPKRRGEGMGWTGSLGLVDANYYI